MPTPAYAWIFDASGERIEGGVEIAAEDRVGTVEIQEFHHDLKIPTDVHTGKLTGVRMHSPARLIKQFDRASPELYRACCEGMTLSKVEIKWFEINDKGEEKPYFVHVLETVKVASVRAYMPNVKSPEYDRMTHLEEVALVYGTITWQYVATGSEWTDSWVTKQ